MRLVTTAVPLADDKTEDDFPAAAYGPDGTLWVAYIAYKDRDDSRRIEAANLKEQPDNFKALYTPEFADQLFVKYYREGKWSEPIAVTEGNEDLKRCAIAVQGDGDGAGDLQRPPQGAVRHFRPRPDVEASRPAARTPSRWKWSSNGRPAKKSAANLSPAACTEQDGNVWVSYAGWNPHGVRLWWRKPRFADAKPNDKATR